MPKSRRRRPRPLGLLATLGAGIAMLLAGVATHVLAGDVKGQILLGPYKPPTPAKPPRAAYNWEIENGVKEVARERVSAPRELAVVLTGEGAGKAPDRIEVPISGGSLLPSTIVVRVGTTVRVRNDDEIGHEIYAEGLDGFSAEATSPKAIRSVNLTKPGSWRLLDKLTPHAHGQLHVLPDLIAIAKIEANGNYTFTDVPAGKYKLQVFHGPDVVASKDVEVGDKTLTVDPLTLTAATAPIAPAAPATK